MTYNQVTRGDSYISKIDKDIKNKFKWHWLEEKDGNGMYLSEWLKVPQKSIFCPARAMPLDPIGRLTSPPPPTPQLLVTSYARLQRAARVA